MPIAVGDKVYDDEVQYKMDSIGIKPVEGDPQGQPMTMRTLPAQATEQPEPQTRDRVMTPQQLEQNRAIVRDPNNIYNDQGEIVDYYTPQFQPIPPTQREGDPLFTPTSSSTMPLQAPTEVTGALKPVGGTGTPGNQYETSLSPTEEAKFQDWKAKNAPNDSGFDYDLRGAFQAGVQPDKETGHWPDTFKKPNHPTFSDQSQYAKDRPDLAGHWVGDTYYPAPSYMNPPERQAPFPRPRMTEILSGLYETAKNAFSLTQAPEWGVDPETGEVHTSTQAIEKAADLAGLMTFGPAPVASKLAEGSLGSFAGVTSRTVDKNKLAEAQILESRGLPRGMIGDVRDYIWKKTGMFRGADNRWRYEIHDSDMKLKEGAFDKTVDGDKITLTPKGSGLPALKDNASLEDILDFLQKGRGKAQTLEQTIDHPELFKAYPELRGLQVKELPPEEIAMGTKGMMLGKTLFLSPDLSQEEVRSVIMHEVQHRIQDIEGFARGGSSEMFRTKQLDAAEAFFKNVRTRTEKDIIASGFLPEELLDLKAAIYDNLKGKPISPIVKEALESAKDSPNFKRLKNIVQSEILLEDAANAHHKLYRRLRGEVEARNVQARLYYELETKKLIPPYRSEEFDMPRMFQNEPPPPWGQGPMKSEGEPIQFRRAANVNEPISDMQREALKTQLDAYEKALKMTPEERAAAREERNKVLSKKYIPEKIDRKAEQEALDAADKSWKEMVLRSVQISKLNKQIDDLMKQYPHSEFDKVRLKKLRQDRSDIEG